MGRPYKSQWLEAGPRQGLPKRGTDLNGTYLTIIHLICKRKMNKERP